MVQNQPNKVHKAHSQAPQRNLSTRSDGNTTKASCRIAVEVIQQSVAGFRPHGSSAVHDMGHSTEPALPSVTISVALMRGRETLWARILGLHGRQS